MTKRTITTTLPDGSTHSMSTAREYTHAVITGETAANLRDFAETKANDPATVAWYAERAERAERAGGTLWLVNSFASRADLAEKTARRLRNMCPDLDVRVIPVD